MYNEHDNATHNSNYNDNIIANIILVHIRRSYLFQGPDGEPRAAVARPGPRWRRRQTDTYIIYIYIQIIYII